MTTVLIAGGGTGGHLMPALAIGGAVQEVHPDWRCVYAGAERGVEAQLLPDRGLPHHLLPLEPIYRQQWWKNVRWLFRTRRVVRAVDRVLDAERPDVVVGTGGYASGPVVWRAARRGIPTGIIDLDVRPGIATRWLSRRVTEVWVAAAEAIVALPAAAQARAVVTGAPIVPPDRSRRTAAMAQFGLSADRPVVVVMCGSQGALAVNRLVADWLRGGGGADMQVIWSTGRGSYQEFAVLDDPPRVRVLPFIDPMADAWSVADVAVARGGMMTISELCAWGIAAILIPLPTAAADHQTHNALAMEQAGAAVLLRQGGLTGSELGAAIEGMLSDGARRRATAAAALRRGKPGAAAEIVERIEELARR